MNQEIEIEGKGLKTIAIRWIVSQGVSTILLVAILYAIGWGITYAMKTAVPEHLRQIQAGYVDVAERHERAVKSIVDSQERERQGLLELLRRTRDQDEIEVEH